MKSSILSKNIGMRRENKIIFFSGLDCSGKSTQIAILRKQILEKNAKVLVFWSRGGYTNNFQFLKDFLRKLARKKLPKPGNSPQRDRALSNPFIRKIWLTISIIDLFYYYVFYLRLKYYLGFNIICDRHLIDTSIDFKLTYPDENTEKWILWKLLSKLMLKPHLHFVSTIPVEVSVNRSKFKFEPFPDSPEVLTQRLELYNKDLENNKSHIFIDGMRDLNEISKEINNLINKI